MNLKYRLLDHPFYQNWSCGEITIEQLSKYGASYLEFIKEIPNYWQKVIDGFDFQSEEALGVIEDEKSHIELWKRFTKNLPIPNDYPIMNEILNVLASMSPSELLGAIHAFEIQQPEVAKTKKDGLLEHYGFQASDVEYFDEHLLEDEHIKFGINLKNNFANPEEFQFGFDKGSELIYHSLDLF